MCNGGTLCPTRAPRKAKQSRSRRMTIGPERWHMVGKSGRVRNVTVGVAMKGTRMRDSATNVGIK
eukprot:994994-Pyramimonas_sp.AAC.1